MIWSLTFSSKVREGYNFGTMIIYQSYTKMFRQQVFDYFIIKNTYTIYKNSKPNMSHTVYSIIVMALGSSLKSVKFIQNSLDVYQNCSIWLIYDRFRAFLMSNYDSPCQKTYRLMIITINFINKIDSVTSI